MTDCMAYLVKPNRLGLQSCDRPAVIGFDYPILRPDVWVQLFYGWDHLYIDLCGIHWDQLRRGNAVSAQDDAGWSSIMVWPPVEWQSRKVSRLTRGIDIRELTLGWTR